ncbi:MAG: sigma-70 family RNA polymerase sigma factor [Clostridia bacterium]|nr:sigma-70 family RNA polymerase sigma factor [Clostridia bacterium]
MQDEKVLLQQAKNGDEKAINQLMNLYKPLVTIIARKYFLINATTDDLIQEGMLGLFKAYRSYNLNSKTSFKTFASVCIKRQIQTALIANNRNKNIPLNTYFSINNQGKILLSVKNDDENDDEEDTGFFITSNNLTPEESVLFREKLDEVDSHINNLLSGFEKKVLHLYIKGLNYIEIAQRLKKEPKSIDNALGRIKIKLRVLRI